MPIPRVASNTQDTARNFIGGYTSVTSSSPANAESSNIPAAATGDPHADSVQSGASSHIDSAGASKPGTNSSWTSHQPFSASRPPETLEDVEAMLDQQQTADFRCTSALTGLSSTSTIAAPATTFGGSPKISSGDGARSLPSEHGTHGGVSFGTVVACAWFTFAAYGGYKGWKQRQAAARSTERDAARWTLPKIDKQE